MASTDPRARASERIPIIVNDAMLLPENTFEYTNQDVIFEVPVPDDSTIIMKNGSLTLNAGAGNNVNITIENITRHVRSSVVTLKGDIGKDFRLNGNLNLAIIKDNIGQNSYIILDNGDFHVQGNIGELGYIRLENGNCDIRGTIGNKTQLSANYKPTIFFEKGRSYFSADYAIYKEKIVKDIHGKAVKEYYLHCCNYSTSGDVSYTPGNKSVTVEGEEFAIPISESSPLLKGYVTIQSPDGTIPDLVDIWAAHDVRINGKRLLVPEPNDLEKLPHGIRGINERKAVYRELVLPLISASSAAYQDNIFLFNKIIHELGINYNRGGNASLLKLTVQHGKAKYLTALLNNGVKPTMSDLHCALQHGHILIAGILINTSVIKNDLTKEKSSEELIVTLIQSASTFSQHFKQEFSALLEKQELLKKQLEPTQPKPQPLKLKPSYASIASFKPTIAPKHYFPSRALQPSQSRIPLLSLRNGDPYPQQHGQSPRPTQQQHHGRKRRRSPKDS